MNFKHGHNKVGNRTPFYKLWVSMRARCYNPNNAGYKNYGARNIKMCDEWRQDYLNFLSWASSSGYSKGLHLDRINNNGNYGPNNCRWVTKAENNRNRRTTKINWDIVNNIREEWCTGLFRTVDLAKKYDLPAHHISKIILNKIWRVL